MTQQTHTRQEDLMGALQRFTVSARRAGFKFQAVHTYTDAEGAPAHWVIRLKNPATGDKWLRPMHWDGSAYVLTAPPTDSSVGKPLYRLHELVARPQDEVVVTEGEYKADRLAARGLLVTTSGGADSAGGAHWSTLKGRKVRIWPDNDAAGARYANAVAAALSALGCAVQIIDVQPLGLPSKGDAADWLAKHPDATAEDVRALACAQPAAEDTSKPEPRQVQAHGTPGVEVADEEAYEWGDGKFQLTDHGVFFVRKDKDGNEKAQWICSPLRVIAKTRNDKSGGWGRFIEWHDDDNVSHQWAMPLELLEGDGTDVRRELAHQGVRIAPGKFARDLLATYLKVWPVDHLARCVERPGWYGGVYMLPNTAIGESKEIVVFQSGHALEPAFGVAGTTASWRESVAALAQGNSRLVFALSVAFAGPLLGIVNEESGGFHLRGKSSTGKTTALKSGASVWGDPTQYTRAWRATANGLEGLAALHNDGVLILDELSQCDPKEAGDAAYLLANGQGKVRANRSGAARAAQRWRLLVLSAGEESLGNLMARAGKKPNAGQEIRLADFDADAGAGLGAFEELHGRADPSAFALAVNDAVAANHGAVGLEWLGHVVRERTQIAGVIERGVREFTDEVTPAGAGGQVRRVARHFAVAAVAGELATHFGLTGWDEDEADHAVKACFDSWLDAFGGAGNREERELLATVRAFFQAHGASRFEALNAPDEQQRVINRAGYVRATVDGSREYWVLSEAFKKEICGGRDHKAAARLLVGQGWIEPGGDGRATQKQRVPDSTSGARVYVFTSKVWEDE